MYGLDMLYQILDKYIENDMDESEHAFIPGLKWADDYRLGRCPEKFWNEIQDVYGVSMSEKERFSVKTVNDLKKAITYQVE